MDKPSVIEDIPEDENNWNMPNNQQKSQNQTQELPLMCLILTMSQFDYLIDYPMYERSLRNPLIYTIWEYTQSSLLVLERSRLIQLQYPIHF